MTKTQQIIKNFENLKLKHKIYISKNKKNSKY